jgi:endonuclease YncB( thermonuclease family)
MKDCKDCQHRYRDRDAVLRCKVREAELTAPIQTDRCHLLRKPEWPCGPEAKYYKDKRDI